MTKPTLICHCDWSKTAKKRWLAKAVLGKDGRYTASAPERVGDPDRLLSTLQAEAGKHGSVFLGFDFPIGLPVHYARRAGVTSFRDFLSSLEHAVWCRFFDVCDTPLEISLHRPFYPNRSGKGCAREHLFEAHGTSSMEPLLRRCERGSDGHRQACSLFWTLGGNQVGKAALSGWREVLIPALADDSVGLWPFDGTLEELLAKRRVVIAETYPAECYVWFSKTSPSKRDLNSRREFGKSLLSWAAEKSVGIERQLREEIETGFQRGQDDAFDAAVGLLGMVQVCLGLHAMNEPKDEARTVEGWIFGR